MMLWVPELRVVLMDLPVPSCPSMSEVQTMELSERSPSSVSVAEPVKEMLSVVRSNVLVDGLAITTVGGVSGGAGVSGVSVRSSLVNVVLLVLPSSTWEGATVGSGVVSGVGSEVGDDASVGSITGGEVSPVGKASRSSRISSMFRLKRFSRSAGLVTKNGLPPKPFITCIRFP